MQLSRSVHTALAAVTAIAVLLMPARPAFAHAQLVKTDPASNATVTIPVTAVTLTFNELVKQQLSTVIVTGADGASASDGTPRSVDKNLIQAVKPLPPGNVSVAWRTVSADGHPLEGRFTFTNAAPAPSSAAPASTAPSPPAAAASTVASSAVPAVPQSGSSSSSSEVVWALAGGGLLVVVLVGGWFWWHRRRTGTT
jgi:methionine-rich copper-binding protein CopC